MTTELRTWFDKAGPLAQTLAALTALLALTAVILLLHRATRALRGKRAADTLTVVAAAMASSVAATGMWHFFSRTMHLPRWIQAVLFAFMEISVLASALRARANVAREGNAGADGLAVWVLTCASGLMSASEANSPQEALVRLGAPLVAAWLWERSMVPERRAQRAAKGAADPTVRWLFSLTRVAVRLGLATALGADLETEDANRRIDRFVRADNRAARAGALTRRHAARRRDRAHARLMEQARMQADPRALYAHLGRQAILDVLARLGGDDAVIDRERARQMQHILAEATGEQHQPQTGTSPATPGAQGTQGEPGTASRTARTADAGEAGRGQEQEQASTPPAHAYAYAHTPETGGRAAESASATVRVATQALHAAFDTADHPPAPENPAPEHPTPRQDELPLHLPVLPTTPLPPVNGHAGPHIPAARQPDPRPAPAHGTARANIPVEPVRFVAAPLPEPEPEPEPEAEPAYLDAYDEDDEPDLDGAEVDDDVDAGRPAPEPAPAPRVDHQLATRITHAMITAAATSAKPPNLVKLANEIGVNPVHVQDTIEGLGGFDALWNRVLQETEAGSGEDDLAYYSA